MEEQIRNEVRLNIVFNGVKKKLLAPGPNTSLKWVLDQSCSLFNLLSIEDQRHLKIQYQKSDLDLDLTLRYAGLPQNPTLELIHSPNIRLKPGPTMDSHQRSPIGLNRTHSNNEIDNIQEFHSSPQRHSKERVQESIEHVLSNNFDKISSPCLLTLSKYISNILNHFEDEKYRKIKLSNAVFQGKVSPAKGAREFLEAVGFQSTSDPNIIQLSSSTSYEILSEYFGMLEKALAELEVPDEQRPRLVQPQQTMVPSSSFDPFKAAVHRNANIPTRPTGSSRIDAHLQQLNERRKELEGNPADVARDTKLIYPQLDGNYPSLVNGDAPADENEATDSSPRGHDTGSVPKALLQKVLRTKQPEDQPLTTKAYRDLQSAKKEKVYRSTILRIRFPDKLCLEGRFHPRNSLQDVYAWIHECLEEGPSINLPAKASSVTRKPPPHPYPFCLYLSPPKQYLKGEALQSSLVDLRLVPAAIINLSWVEDSPFYLSQVEKGHIEPTGLASRTQSHPSPTTSKGQYLAPSLLLIADDKDSGFSASSTRSKQTMDRANSDVKDPSCHIELSKDLEAASAYPVGQPLHPEAATVASTLDADSKGESKATGGSKKSAKPKWFKL